MNTQQINNLIKAISSGNVPVMERKGGTALQMITGIHVVDRDGYIRKVIHIDPKTSKTTTEILETPILSNHLKDQDNAQQ